MTSLKRLFGFAPCIIGKFRNEYAYSYNEGTTWVVGSFWKLPVGIAWILFTAWLGSILDNFKMRFVLSKREKDFW